MDSLTTSSNLTHGPIAPLVRQLAVPVSIGFFFNTMYNVVDTIYGGMISTEALASLAISFPLFFIIIAFSHGLSTGATALIANALGAGDKDEAEMLHGQTLSYAVLLSVIVTIIGITSAPSILRVLGAEGEYLKMALVYMNTIFYGSIFFMFEDAMNAALMARGETRPLRNALIVGFLLNLILDPWMIYGGFGMPRFGFMGVALATVTIKVLTGIYFVQQLIKRGIINRSIGHRLRPRLSYFKQISLQGLPVSLNMLTVALGIFVITRFVSHFGTEAVAAYGIATRIEQIALLPSIGLNAATLTLVGQNLGALQFARMRETLRVATRYGAYLAVVGCPLLFFFAGQLMGLFTRDQMVISVGVGYLKMASVLLWAYIMFFVTSATMQGYKKPSYPMLIGVIRQFLAPLVVIDLFAFKFGWGLNGIWAAVFVVNAAAAVFSYWLTLRKMPGST